MNIWKNNRKQQRKEWEASLETWKSHHYRCSTCRDTGKCQNCQGAKCMECDYTGVCQACVDAQHEYLEGLA